MNTIIKNADEIHARGKFEKDSWKNHNKIMNKIKKSSDMIVRTKDGTEYDMRDYFSQFTLNNMYWAKLGLDYCGG
jgi:hypothetical protein